MPRACPVESHAGLSDKDLDPYVEVGHQAVIGTKDPQNDTNRPENFQAGDVPCNFAINHLVLFRVTYERRILSEWPT